MISKEVSLGMGAVALAVAAALAGCNGSGGTTGTTSGTNSTITGVITGFGSVYVNGVEYDTSNASYTVDGAPGNDDYDLDVGMKVSIEGTVNDDGVTGTANSIEYIDDLEGIVMDISGLLPDGTGSINIMGQTVMLNALTVFDSDVSGITSPTDINTGMVVEVSGHSSGTGSIMASRIEVKAAELSSYGEEIELKGVVSQVDTASESFRIGQLIVDYSNAYRDDLPVDPAAWDGLYVEVKSQSAPVDNGDGSYTLAATVVEREGDGDISIDASEGEEVEMRGIIMSVSSPTEFMLDGQAVSIVLESDDSDEEESSDDEHITSVDAGMIGRMAEVEGYVDGNGVLIAHEVEFEDGDDSSLNEFRDYVQSVDLENGTLTLQDGTTLLVTNNTILRDSIDSNPEHYFDLADLRPSDYVEVHAFTDGNGDLVAAKLEREDGPES